MRNFILTSEAVTAGHPDKLCDQISDAVIDAALTDAPATACIAECAIASGLVFLSIRHARRLGFDPAALARRVLAEAGYPEAAEGPGTTVVLDSVLTPELGHKDTAPGQMTTAFGYACDHNPARMPAPIELAHSLAGAFSRARQEETLAWLAPDALAQVARRLEARRPAEIAGIGLTYYRGGADGPVGDDASAALQAALIDRVLEAKGWDPSALPQPSILGREGPGGPKAHSGLTGRKTADDSYGSFARQGAAALSGKDPSRIDRIAAYAARQAVVSVVAAGLATECEVQLSYVVGAAAPASIEIDTFGSAVKPEAEIDALLAEAFDFRAGAISERLGLWALPTERGGRFYRDLAVGGQVGRPNLDLPWDSPVPLG